jgi:hypothetical protein
MQVSSPDRETRVDGGWPACDGLSDSWSRRTPATTLMRFSCAKRSTERRAARGKTLAVRTAEQIDIKYGTVHRGAHDRRAAHGEESCIYSRDRVESGAPKV